MIRRPPRSTLSSSSAASDVYKRQLLCRKQLAEKPSPQDGDGSDGSLDGLMIPMLITLGIVAGFLFGLNPALVAACGAAVLMLVRSRLIQKIYREVDWSLLVLFVGLFLIIGAAEHTD